MLVLMSRHITGGNSTKQISGFALSYVFVYAYVYVVAVSTYACADALAKTSL